MIVKNAEPVAGPIGNPLIQLVRCRVLSIASAANSSLHLVGRTPSAQDRENDKRHQIEQNDSYLEDTHPGVVKGVELVTGQAKPSTMDALNPIMREHEEQEPHQQYSVVDDRTP
jgi:hypothetical protein